MDSKKDNKYYANKIITDLAFIAKHTSGLTQKDLAQDEILLNSVMFRLIQISENADRLTEDFRAHHGNIPWWAIRGLRNRIVTSTEM